MANRSLHCSLGDAHKRQGASKIPAPLCAYETAHAYQDSDATSAGEFTDRDRVLEALAKAAKDWQGSSEIRHILELANRLERVDIFRHEMVSIGYIVCLVLQRRFSEASSVLSEIQRVHKSLPLTLPVTIRVVRAGRIRQQLTYCEMEILTLMAQGITNQQIAKRCKIAPSTARWHIRNVMRKLRTKGRIEVLQQACSLGLIHSYVPQSKVSGE